MNTKLQDTIPRAGVYHFKRRIPRDLVGTPEFGDKEHEQFSLRTKDRAVAKDRANRASKDFDDRVRRTRERLSGKAEAGTGSSAAARANAIYRDMIQALVMVDLDVLVLAVPNAYKYMSGGNPVVSKDFEKTCAVADAVFSHSRVRMPYGLVVIGY